MHLDIVLKRGHLGIINAESARQPFALDISGHPECGVPSCSSPSRSFRLHDHHAVLLGSGDPFLHPSPPYVVVKLY